MPNFWNNWDFKSLLQIVLIVVGLTITYTKLEAQVETNRLLYLKDIEHIYNQMRSIEIELRAVKEELKLLNKR
ncbi:MAG: hypothetical protein IPM96_15930 [Ignavibacteria bacterium]|nr:hypothetical protein [Ignavibacteria bacterium]